MSPTMQDSKFEVIMSSESDLEEGEIPEFDYVAPKAQCEDGEIPDDDFELKYSKFSGTKFKMKHRKDDHHIRQGRLSKDDRKFKDYKTDYSATYRSSSSDREYVAEPKKNLKNTQKHSSPVHQENAEKKSKRKHIVKGSYGTVEDIMSQIDKTLCRRNHDYERRRLKDKYSSDRNRKARSPVNDSKSKSRHYKYTRSSSLDSDSENFPSKSKKITKSSKLVCKRKREKETKKSNEVIYICSDNSISGNEDDDAPRKRNRTEKEKRDFDEYRKQLLEKLSKEKSESKLKCENIPLPDEEDLSHSSDIQEIEMIDDTNTFVDDDVIKEIEETSKLTSNSTETSGKSFMDTFYVTRDVFQSTSQPEGSENEDDDTELIKLRLLALTSNRKKKDAQISDDASSHSLDFEQASTIDAKSEENSLDSKEENDADLDRDELLLRAEALKTALLKKHQKRLKKATADIKNDSFNEIDSKKTNLDNSKISHSNFLKVEDEKLNMGEEISLKMKADGPKILDSGFQHNLNDEVEGSNENSVILAAKNSLDYEIDLNKINENESALLHKSNELSSLEIARRKLPRTLGKNREVSSFEIARRKLPRNIEKFEENSSLEIARRKLLKVRSSLNQKSMPNTTLPMQEDIPKDSLQARLLALANETSLPQPLLQPEPLKTQERNHDSPQNDNLPILPINIFDKPTENSKIGEIVKMLVGNSEKSNKKLKRLRWRERRRMKRKKAFLNKINNSNQDSTDSTKLEGDDEKLRVQLLNDLDRKKNLNENNKDSEITDKPTLPNSGPIEAIKNNPSLDKQQIEIKNNKNIVNNKATVLPKVPKPEIQRIIIHLGADSSDDDDLEPEDKPRNLINQNDNGVKEKVPNPIDGTIPKVPLSIDVEKSVELLLQRARQEADGKQGKNQKTINATPEAVYKHLPPSQRLEYMRLKQKIAEKENLKKKISNTANNGTNQRKVSSTNNPTDRGMPGIGRIVAASIRSIKNEIKALPKSSSQDASALIKSTESPNSVSNEKNLILENSKTPHSPVKCDKTVLELYDDTKKVTESTTVVPNKLTANSVTRSPIKIVTTQKIVIPVAGQKKIISSPLNGKKPIVPDPQKKIVDPNHGNIVRLKLLLKNIKNEKTIEERYEKEIQKLKSQLSLLELKRKQQRLKIERLAKESKLIYAKFQSNREESKTLDVAQPATTNGNEKTEDKEILPKNSDSSNEIKKDSEESKDAVSGSREKTENVCEVQSDPKTNSDAPVQTLTEQKLEVTNNEKNDNHPESTAVSSSSSSDLKEYNSPLQAFTTRTEDTDCKRIDPNTIMCQYDLLGKCNDEECTFQHYRT